MSGWVDLNKFLCQTYSPLLRISLLTNYLLEGSQALLTSKKLFLYLACLQLFRIALLTYNFLKGRQTELTSHKLARISVSWTLIGILTLNVLPEGMGHPSENHHQQFFCISVSWPLIGVLTPGWTFGRATQPSTNIKYFFYFVTLLVDLGSVFWPQNGLPQGSPIRVPASKNVFRILVSWPRIGVLTQNVLKERPPIRVLNSEGIFRSLVSWPRIGVLTPAWTCGRVTHPSIILKKLRYMHSLKVNRDHPTSTTAKAGACVIVWWPRHKPSRVYIGNLDLMRMTS